MLILLTFSLTLRIRIKTRAIQQNDVRNKISKRSVLKEMKTLDYYTEYHTRKNQLFQLLDLNYTLSTNLLHIDANKIWCLGVFFQMLPRVSAQLHKMVEFLAKPKQTKLGKLYPNVTGEVNLNIFYNVFYTK